MSLLPPYFWTVLIHVRVFKLVVNADIIILTKEGTDLFDGMGDILASEPEVQNNIDHRGI